MKGRPGPAESFARLVEIVAKLRNPEGGCPWDLEQTHESLRQYVVEEAYEVVEAINAGGTELSEELGDLLLQVMLHSQIGADEKRFDVVDVVEGISGKLIKRHPHVFGDAKVKDSHEVLQNWEQIKNKDRDSKDGMLDGIPKSMPALLKAHRIGQKVGRVGFDWPEESEVREKVAEELREFLDTPPGDRAKLEEELGDLLFTLAQLARKMNSNAEELLAFACEKFTRRFRRVEEMAGGGLNTLGREELEKLWERAKQAG